MTEDKLRENIKKQRKSLGLSAGKLGEKIGLSTQGVYDIESGKVRLQYGVLLKIKAVLPDLITGLESVVTTYKDNYISDSDHKTSYPQKTPFLAHDNKENLGTTEYIKIPEYDVHVSAGHGSYPNDHALTIGYRPFSLEWIDKKGLQSSDLRIIRVTGDSMEPLLKDKDVVMIDTSKTKPSESMPYAIRFCDDLLVKTIQRLGDGNLALVSRNKDYNDIIIDKNNPPEEFTIIGAVVWHAHSWI